MNAYGRFARAAGAPTIENVGMHTVTLLAVAVVYGTGGTLSNVTTTEIVILGLERPGRLRCMRRSSGSERGEANPPCGPGSRGTIPRCAPSW